jgi:molybdopterin synthase sulfur carrier subunit
MTTVLFFGRTAERLGRSCQIELPEGATVGELRRRLAATSADAREALMRPDVRASVDRTVAGDEAPVAPGQEVAFFSVFSGG